ncbi:MAG: hypothetical protein IT223_08990 [Crocinitomicaceae bacterium]|nr:hypothetical protein [Crocinitomicaceae bacterium]
MKWIAETLKTILNLSKVEVNRMHLKLASYASLLNRNGVASFGFLRSASYRKFIVLFFLLLYGFIQAQTLFSAVHGSVLEGGTTPAILVHPNLSMCGLSSPFSCSMKSDTTHNFFNILLFGKEERDDLNLSKKKPVTAFALLSLLISVFFLFQDKVQNFWPPFRIPFSYTCRRHLLLCTFRI